MKRLIPLLIIFLTACGDTDKTKAREEAAPVRVSEIRQESAPRILRAVGSAKASASVAVMPRVSGEIISINFKEGQDVKEGQTLLQIDPRPYAAALKEKQGALAKSQAQYAKAAEDRKRFGRLVSNGYVSRDAYEQASTDAEALRATVLSDKAAAESAELDLAYCTITAPISGRIGSLKINKGNMIKSSSSEAIVNIDALEPCYVSFSIPEANLPLIQARLGAGPVKLTATPQGGRPQEGELTLIENSVDSKTGSIPLRGTFPNSDRGLWPGQYVEVSVPLGEFENALIVPSKAVQTGRDGSYIYVLNNDSKAEYRKVNVLFANNGESVIEGDVRPGEKAVTEGQVRLIPGMPARALE